MSDVELDLDSDPDKFFAHYVDNLYRPKNASTNRNINEQLDEPLHGPPAPKITGSTGASKS